ncbi:MAG: helix-turn-helix domain-containing protein [Candidatus Aenigmarchaeota archaeon]|nr:helix-turn-helix domain-containing protein [Candidatus Aenigmarchaeota archaeon]
MDEWQLAKESLARKIAGEIVLSEEAGKTIQKWRNIFKIPQRVLANYIKITPSVISDYESGRRKSPGIKVVKKMVGAMISIDEAGGGKVTRQFSENGNQLPITKAIIDIKEFDKGVGIEEFCEAMSANVVAGKESSHQEVYGYTIVDSLRAILEFSYSDLVKLYGITTKRALIFTNTSTGRSPMVAIKVTNLRPALIILHGAREVDEIAKRIADVEGIPLAVSKLAKVEDVVAALHQKFG